MIRARRYLARGIAVMSVLLFAAVVIVDTLAGWPLGIWQFAAVASNTTIGLVYVGVGLLLIERRPANLVGPMLLLIGVVYAVAGPIDLYLSKGLEQAWVPHAALAMSATGYLIGALRAIALMLFPDGSPPSRRWWAIIAIAALGCVAAVAALTFGSSTFTPFYPSVASPFAIPGFPKRTLVGIGDTAMAMTMLAGIAAIAIRWWRGDALARAQTTWVLAAVVVMFVINRVAVEFDATDDFVTWLVGLAQNTSVILLPIAMTIAILRYRLYDIDRIVSRTIGYAVVSAVLFGVFFLVNLGLQRLLGDLVGSAPVVVAGSTLVVAALFQPLRTRVQRIVDRRFHRARYDAERTVAGFAGRLRDQLDLPTLTGELQRATADAVEPATTTIWLRSKVGGSP